MLKFEILKIIYIFSLWLQHKEVQGLVVVFKLILKKNKLYKTVCIILNA